MPILSNKVNQKLFINSAFVSGLQSLNFSFSPALNLSTRIEETQPIYLHSTPIRGALGIEIASNAQSILDIYTGNGFFSGKIEYGDRFFDFKSGYVNTFNLTYNSPNPIRNSITATIYGSIAEYTGGASVSKIQEADPLTIYDMNYVELNLAEASGNPVQSFDISINTPRYEQYLIDEFFPSQVGVSYPIEINYNISFIINDLNMYKNYSFYTGQDLRDISLIFYKNRRAGQAGDAVVKTINLSKAKLDTERVSLDLKDGVASLSFTSYILSGAI